MKRKTTKKPYEFEGRPPNWIPPSNKKFLSAGGPIGEAASDAFDRDFDDMMGGDYDDDY